MSEGALSGLTAVEIADFGAEEVKISDPRTLIDRMNGARDKLNRCDG